MGACGSASVAALTAPRQHLGSELDMSLTPDTEKRHRCVGAAPHGVGFACRKGVKPLPNQDSWCLHLEGDLAAYGVFDGHGARGHLVSHAVKCRLAAEVAQAAASEAGAVAGRVQLAYQRAHRDICKSPQLRNSGTTATVVVHDRRRERLLVSHVGDSAAVLLRRGGRGLAAEALTAAHRPEAPGERARILRAGGEVVVCGGCHRVARRGRGGGLNLSRSLGDAAAHAIGVSEVPAVHLRDVGAEDVALLIASDGVWDVISPQEAADLVQGLAPSQAMEAAGRIASEAMARWLRYTGSQKADDISAVLAWLPHSGKVMDDHSPCSTVPPSCSSESSASQA